MTSSYFPDDAKPQASLEALVMRHGAVTIGLAYLRAAFANRNRRGSRDLAISDHLRRDVGLGPLRHGHDRIRYGGIE